MVRVVSKPQNCVSIFEYVRLERTKEWHKISAGGMSRDYWESVRKPMMLRGAFAIGATITFDMSADTEQGQ